MRRIFVLLTVAALMALMLMVSAMPAFAVASPQASCNGIGGSTETLFGGPGARAEIAHEVKHVFAVDAGTTPGAFTVPPLNCTSDLGRLASAD